MDFLKQYDLNFVCRVFEWCAVITFIAGVILSFILGIEKDRYDTELNFVVIISGFLVSFLNAMFWLFLSRIGDAIDDVRNKYVYPENETTEVETE